MNVLVTGATGFLGQHLVAALRERGDEVRALALPGEDTASLEAQGAAIYRGDVRDPGSLDEPTRGANGVVHLAAMAGEWRPLHEYYAVNVGGTENVCRAALAAGVDRFVHMSTWSVYPPGVGQRLGEDRPLAPLRVPYALTKTDGDRRVQRMITDERLPAVIIRAATFFGPGDRPNFGRMADRLRARKAFVIGSGQNSVPLVYVTDVVQAVLLALERDRAVGRVYNVASDEIMTQEELWQAIAEEIGAMPPRVRLPYRALYGVAFAAERAAALAGYRLPPPITRHGVTLLGSDNRLAIDRACAELGYAPRVPLSEGLRRAADRYLHRDTPRGSPTLRPLGRGVR